MLAKIVNDTADILDERGACEFFASKLAPTVSLCGERACSLAHNKSVTVLRWSNTLPMAIT